MSEKLTVAITAEIEDLKKQLANANNELSEFSDKADASAKSVSESYDNTTSSIEGLISGYVSLTAAITVLNTTFQNSLKTDALSSAFNNIFKSSEIGQAQFERLRQKADELGLEFVTLADSYKLFASSTTQAGMSIAETNRIFDSVSKAASSLKLSSQDSERALKALAQMMSKGTVSSEELKQQLGDSMPGAFGIFAKSLGVSTQELTKMLDAGKIMANEALPKFATELEKTFGGKTIANIKGLTAEWNRFKNTIFSSTGWLSTIFEVPLKKVNEFIISIKDLYKLISNPEQFNADEVTRKLTGAIDITNTEKGLNELILKFTDVQSKLEKGTYMWRAYTNAIIEAGAKIKDLNKKTVKVSVATPQDLSMITGAKEQIAEANELYDIYKQYPQLLSTMGAEYANNPFFRNLINGEIKAKTDEWNKSLREIKTTSDTFGDNQIKLLSPEETENIENLVMLLGTSLTSAFDAALISGQNFGQVLAKAIGDLIKKLIAALAVASALTALLSLLPSGKALASVGGFSGILKTLTGFDFGGGGSSEKVSTAVSTTSNSGSVSFEIRGDKLYGVLQNYQGRLDKLI